MSAFEDLMSQLFLRMSMNNLCDDLLIYLTVLCDFKEILHLISINHRFYKLLKSDSVWKTRIQFDFGQNISSNQEKSYIIYYQYLSTKKNFLQHIKSCQNLYPFKN